MGLVDSTCGADRSPLISGESSLVGRWHRARGAARSTSQRRQTTLLGTQKRSLAPQNHPLAAYNLPRSGRRHRSWGAGASILVSDKGEESGAQDRPAPSATPPCAVVKVGIVRRRARVCRGIWTAYPVVEGDVSGRQERCSRPTRAGPPAGKITSSGRQDRLCGSTRLDHTRQGTGLWREGEGLCRAWMVFGARGRLSVPKRRFKTLPCLGHPPPRFRELGRGRPGGRG